MWPMSIAETPIAAIRGSHRATGDGVHLVARHYKKGVRLDTHMHSEAQLVYAAKGTMQVTTPKGRWLVPPDRAVWVPARLEHAIDVLRNSWCGCRGCCMRRSSRCSMAAIALNAPGFWLDWPCSNCITPRIPPRSFRCRVSRAADVQPTSCSATPPHRTRSRH